MIIFFILVSLVSSTGRTLLTRAKTSDSGLYILIVGLVVNVLFGLFLFFPFDGISPVMKLTIYATIYTLGGALGQKIGKRFEKGKYSVGGTDELRERIERLEKRLPKFTMSDEIRYLNHGYKPIKSFIKRENKDNG